ncbi:MAG: methylmalonyl-CoA mutase family protein [Archangium sp.]
MTSFSEWRAGIENFEKLVAKTPEGLSIEPLYVESKATSPLSREGEGRGEGEPITALPFHEDGADAADELALLMAQAVTRLSEKKLNLHISVGRDTFPELCKLRAARLLFSKLGVRVHITAICSKRTMTQRDPWVNMLRCTTQVFAAILGGADEITPSAFDSELGNPSELAQRIARNTQLILEQESSLGRVHDPAAGSYFLETFTDQLAREAWKRFQAIEKAGGFAQALPEVKARIAKAWDARLRSVSSRKLPVLGVSEFANTTEELPRAAHSFDGPGHRDSESFEALRLRVEEKKGRVTLVTLGSFAESRARVGFASNFFAAGGFSSSELPLTPNLSLAGEGVACLCGTDEAYAASAESASKQLKAAGFGTVLIAGKPSSIPGIDGYIFFGADVIDTLNVLAEGLS